MTKEFDNFGKFDSLCDCLYCLMILYPISCPEFISKVFKTKYFTKCQIKYVVCVSPSDFSGQNKLSLDFKASNKNKCIPTFHGRIYYLIINVLSSFVASN